MQITNKPFSDYSFEKIGETMAKHHQKHLPKAPSIDIVNHYFDRLAKNLQIHGGDVRCEEELAILRKVCEKAPVTSENYGYVVGNPSVDALAFEPNTETYSFPAAVLTTNAPAVNESNTFFFLSDLALFENSLKVLTDEKRQQTAWQDFLRGYRKKMPFHDENAILFPLFIRIRNLEKFISLLSSTAPSNADETPEMLLKRCSEYAEMNDLSEHFGEPVLGYSIKGDDAPDFDLMKEAIPALPTVDLMKTIRFYEEKLSFHAVFDSNSAVESATLYRDDIRIRFIATRAKAIHTNRELYGIEEDIVIRTEEPEILEAELIMEHVTIVKELSKTDMMHREFIFEDVDGRHVLCTKTNQDGREK